MIEWLYDLLKSDSIKIAFFVSKKKRQTNNGFRSPKNIKSIWKQTKIVWVRSEALSVPTKSPEEGGSESATDIHWRFRWVFLFYQTYRNPRIFSSFGKCAMTPSRNILFIIYLSWRAICKENSPYIHYTEIEEL